jgi:hypothetical protein
MGLNSKTVGPSSDLSLSGKHDANDATMVNRNKYFKYFIILNINSQDFV